MMRPLLVLVLLLLLLLLLLRPRCNRQQPSARAHAIVV